MAIYRQLTVCSNQASESILSRTDGSSALRLVESNLTALTAICPTHASLAFSRNSQDPFANDGSTDLGSSYTE